MIRPKYNVSFAIDDNKEICDMWKGLGIATLHVIGARTPSEENFKFTEDQMKHLKEGGGFVPAPEKLE